MADAPRNPGQEAEHTLRRVTVAVAIAPLLLVSAILFYAYDIIYRDTVLDHLRTQALRHAQIIDRFLEERAATLRLEAHSAPVSRLADTRYLEARLTALNDAFGPMYGKWPMPARPSFTGRPTPTHRGLPLPKTKRRSSPTSPSGHGAAHISS
jgi:hypothetical protein